MKGYYMSGIKDAMLEAEESGFGDMFRESILNGEKRQGNLFVSSLGLDRRSTPNPDQGLVAPELPLFSGKPAF